VDGIESQQPPERTQLLFSYATRFMAKDQFREFHTGQQAGESVAAVSGSQIRVYFSLGRSGWVTDPTAGHEPAKRILAQNSTTPYKFIAVA
jgi:hypothetical protein